MTAAARLPDNAPFPADSIALLNRVIGQSSPTQRAWLSGFLAGMEAAGTQPAAAAPPAAKRPLSILFLTESGNAEALAARTKRDAAKLGFAARVLDAADTSMEALAKTGNLVVIASTWGEGEPPQRAIPFMEALLAESAPRMEGLTFAVLALGDRAYAQFCETGRRVDERLAALGGKRAAPRLDCDLDYEAPAAEWLGKALAELRGKDEAAAPSVIHVDFGQQAGTEHGKSNPFQAEITELVNLNSSRSAKQTYHVELSLEGSGLAYEPGDAIGVVPQNDPREVERLLDAAKLQGDAALHKELLERRDITTLTGHLVRGFAQVTGDKAVAALAEDPSRLAEFLSGRFVSDLLEAYPAGLGADQLLGLLRSLPPRLYSVASSPRAVGEEAHLLIGAVRYETHGRARAGVTSGLVGDRRRVGEALPVYVKPNTHFRLPADPGAPIIMIGPGTGIAPFRGFMQDRDATGAKGRSWLFFGDRQYTHDFLYQLEWQDFLARGVLGRLSLAFSRDQDAKQYVQHRILENARDLHAWIEDGATVYVCGDQTHMARDVHAALRAVVAQGAAVSDEAAEERLSTMKKQGRYLLDVY